MYVIQSFDDCERLNAFVNLTYPIKAERIRKHRDWIGCVYVIECAGEKYILKIYRPFHAPFARNSIGILKFLAAQNYPAATIVDTAAGSPYSEIMTPNGNSIAILYKYICGEEPDSAIELEPLAVVAAELHNVMAGYNGEIAVHGKKFFIDRYIDVLGRVGFPSDKTAELRAYGNELWARFDLSARGFCHGDFHTGNMLRDRQGAYWLIDFDAACRAHTVADIATICDSTDYFTFREQDFGNTTRRLDRFLAGYLRTRSVSNRDVNAVYDFIAIRHFDIQATITDCQGYSIENFANQHKWLMQWRSLCAQRINY